jgi:two-component system, OmpR family, response regulator
LIGTKITECNGGKVSMISGRVAARRRRGNVASGMGSILIVEDDAIIGDRMAQYLEMSQFITAVVDNGVAMDALLDARVFDLIILDLNLPGENGLSICRRLRNRDKGHLPIVIVTAQSDDIDKIVGLEMGADDYVTIPFIPGEFLARVRSVLRRVFWSGGVRIAEGGRRYWFAGWHLDVFTGEALALSGKKVVLTQAETNLLQIFCEHPSCVLTRNQLIDMMHGPTAEPFERSIDILVSRLRKKLEATPKVPQLIQTVRSIGYVFSTPVTRA